MTSTTLRIAATAATTTIAALVIRHFYDISTQRFLYKQFGAALSSLPPDLFFITALPGIVTVITITFASVIVYLAWRQ